MPKRAFGNGDGFRREAPNARFCSIIGCPGMLAPPVRRRVPVAWFYGGCNGMFSHILVGSNDIARSKKFYDALFTAIGGQPGAEMRPGRIAYTHNGARF